jgi:hypothetical protein
VSVKYEVEGSIDRNCEVEFLANIELNLSNCNTLSVVRML